MDVTVNARRAAPDQPVPFQALEDWIDDLSSDAAVQAMAAAGDVALVLDRDGVICDVAVATRELATDGFAQLLQHKWVDTVAADSRIKIGEILADAVPLSRLEPSVQEGVQGGARGRAASAKAAAKTSGKSSAKSVANGGASAEAPLLRWREINQQVSGGLVPIRYCALSVGRAGRVLALGRDLRGAVEMQQRLLQIEQTMERDYSRLRQIENRYRMLFHAVGEAVLVVDAATRRIVESNPAAGALLGVEHAALIGKPVSWFVAMESQEAVAALLGPNLGGAKAASASVTLAEGRGPATMSASLFRQDRVTHVLVRLAAQAKGASGPHAVSTPLLSVIDRMPDAMVAVSEDLTITDANHAFLDLAQLPDPGAAIGAPLARFLGRSTVDLSVLVQTLREHGWVRNFSTAIRTPFDSLESVEVSAGAALRDGRTVFGFAIRPAARVNGDNRRDLESLPRSVEQLTDLIGRVPLKEIVRETTDIIERLCVEAALKLTGDNRASAAELLGLSRQSLYSKLHRFGISGGDEEAD